MQQSQCFVDMRLCKKCIIMLKAARSALTTFAPRKLVLSFLPLRLFSATLHEIFPKLRYDRLAWTLQGWALSIQPDFHVDFPFRLTTIGTRELFLLHFASDGGLRQEYHAVPFQGH